MKRSLLVLLLVLGISAALLSGCDGSSDEIPKETNPAEKTMGQEKDNEEKEAKKEQEELAGWVKEAAEKHVQAKLWGTNSKTVEVNANGEEKETQKSEKTMDNEKQIIMFLYHFDTNDQTTFWTKEGDKVYQYEEMYSADSSQKPHFLKIPGGEDGTAYYESEAKDGGLPFENTILKEIEG